MNCSLIRQFVVANIANKLLDFSVWHKRLRYAPLSKLKYVASVPNPSDCQEVCLTCPMAKFAKLPYDLNEYHANAP